MELDQFITATLNSIIKGINGSKDFAIENGAKINPLIGPHERSRILTMNSGHETLTKAISEIKFDIAITTSSEKDKAGGLGINVFSANVGGKLTRKDLAETVSRIKFSVNDVLPNTANNEK